MYVRAVRMERGMVDKERIVKVTANDVPRAVRKSSIGTLAASLSSGRIGGEGKREGGGEVHI